MARRSGPALPSRQKRPSPSCTPEEREWRTQQRYLKVLREVKEECGDSALSSDEEGMCPPCPAPSVSHRSTAAAACLVGGRGSHFPARRPSLWFVWARGDAQSRWVAVTAHLAALGAQAHAGPSQQARWSSRLLERTTLPAGE